MAGKPRERAFTKLTRRRFAAGLEQGELAALARTSRATISRLENPGRYSGVPSPTLALLAHLAHVLDCHYTDLVEDEWLALPDGFEAEVAAARELSSPGAS